MGAAPIGPGDYVECVSFLGVPVGPSPTRQPDLVVGAVYCIEDVVDGSLFLDGLGAFALSDIPGCHEIDGERFAYCVSCFKPIYRRDETLTARLLSDIPADAPASPEEVVA